MSIAHLHSPPRVRTHTRTTVGARFDPPDVPARPRLRLPSVTGLLVRLLVVAFVLIVLWRLALLGLDTYETARFTRPPIQTATPRAELPPATPEGLQAVLQDVSLPNGVVGLYVRNLATGVGAGVNADRKFAAASLYKIPVLVEVFKQQRLKRFGWDDELTIGPQHWTDGSGVLQARVGQSLRIGELLRLMIAESDNIAANMLVDLVGPANVNQTVASLGLRTTHVVDRFRENAQPTTSAEDMGRLLELIGSGRLVDAGTSEEAVRLLESPQAQSWLADGLPAWGKLAHKWGDVPNARHDAGIVFTPRNQIVVVVLTENGGATNSADLIRSVGRRVVGYFEGPGP